MKKIKADDFKTPKDFQDEYLPIATPLNTEMFKETNPCFQKVAEAEQQFVLPKPCLQKVPEAEPCFVSPEHFVLPQTPSPIPTLSPIPEPQQTKYLPFEQEISIPEQTTMQQEELQTEQTLYQQTLYEQMQSQNIYEQLLEQPYNEQQYNEQPYNEQTYNEQDEIQKFLTQTETNECEQQILTQTETNECGEETNDVVMSVITEVLNNPIQATRTGKNITMLKKQYCLQEEEEEEEEEREKEELRTTTKNNKRFHKHLILKKKDDIVKKFPILSQKNSDLIVSAENKFKELKSIFILKKKYIEKNKTLKEYIYGLELVEHRYRCETERLNKKKK